MSGREMLARYARVMRKDRIRIGGAACGCAVCINSLLWGYAPRAGVHAQLARGICSYYQQQDGDMEDLEALAFHLRDGGYVTVIEQLEYLSVCIREYRDWERRSRG